MTATKFLWSIIGILACGGSIGVVLAILLSRARGDLPQREDEKPKEPQKTFQANSIDQWRVDIVTDDKGQLIRLPKSVQIAETEAWLEVRPNGILVLHRNVFSFLLATAPKEPSRPEFTDLCMASRIKGREDKEGLQEIFGKEDER